MKKLILSVIPVLFLLSLISNETDSINIKPKLKFSGAQKALDFWSRQRAYPNDVIPDDKYFAGYEYFKQNFTTELDAPGGGWEQIGPHNIGGRTISIKLNPLNGNTVFAGSASGGLWRSYTGGVGTSSWKFVPTGYPVLGVGAIDIHPSDTNTIYIGTGEVYGYQNSIGGMSVRTTRGSYGIGILKTTNYGQTWTKSLDWSYNQRRGVQVVRINPLNPNTVWAGTTEGTYRSYDAGTTWQQVNNVIMVTDLIINPSDTNTIMIACGNLGSTGNGLYRTTNGGGNWTRMTSSLPNSYGGKANFSVYKAQPNIVYASIGNGSATGAGTWLAKTTNNGDTWTITSTFDYATYQGWFAHFVAVNQTNPDILLAAGVDVYKSIQSGANLERKSVWSAWFFGRTPIGGPEGPPNYSHADHHAYDYHPDNPNIVYLANDGGIFRTTDFGESFAGLNGGYQTTQFYNGFTSSFTDSLFAIGGMQDNATAFYDGDLAWYRVIGGDGCMTAINQRNNDTVYGSSQNLNIRRSTNRGLTYGGISVPGSGITGFVATYVLGNINPQILFAGRNIIYKSINGGNSFNTTNNGIPLDGNPALCLNVSPLNDNVVYATTAPVNTVAGIFRTTNGGTSWTNITGGLPDRYYIDVVADPILPGGVYVTLSGFGSSHIYKSTDFGNTWIDINDNLPDVPTSAVAIDPMNNNIIYLGNDVGVFVSTTGGNNWVAFQDGVDDAMLVMDLSISPSNRKLRAVTHGRGVFERDMLDPAMNISGETELVETYRLEQNFPNPFNPNTTIRYNIPKSSDVKLEVYDLTGRKVSTLVNAVQSPGTYQVNFNAQMLSSGMYFYKLEAGEFVEVRKMVVVR